MPYAYQLKTLEAYKEAYQKSIENPEAFWADIAQHLPGAPYGKTF